MKRRVPLAGDAPAAPAAPERTAFHDAARRNGCPRETLIASSPGDCRAVIRVFGRCMAAGIEAEARRVSALAAGAGE